jgi:hypothetical protein
MFMVFLSGRESVHGFFNCLFIQCICIAIVDPINNGGGQQFHKNQQREQLTIPSLKSLSAKKTAT